ncbi:MAG: FAD-dependent oxidoreductase [Geminicoccaceae bacterium]|nr:MAG: FAD-dependent oxidoreductase [Geminicoccaceae bacterium]
MAATLYDVVVVGAGPAGVATAVVAARQGLRTALIDPAVSHDAAGDDCRAVALMPGSRDRLIDLELWDELAAAARALTKVRIHDTSTGVEHLYRGRDLGRSALTYALTLTELRRGLWAALAATPAVDHIHHHRLVSLNLEGGQRRIALENGTTLLAKLVVGADGRESSVREAAGLTAKRSELAQSALIFALAGDGLDGDTAIEQLRPEGPLAVLPLQDQHFAVTWIDGPAQTQRRRRLPSDDLLDELATALGYPGITAMELTTPTFAIRLGTLQADRFVAPRLALVADAAHGGHPIHAQGFNLGIGDVHELAMLWRVEGERFASAETLARYQRNRRLSVAPRLNATDVMNRVFGAANAPWAFARGNVAQALATSEGARLAASRQTSRAADDDHVAG